ncbi:hypothetical protein ACHAW6_011074 [Cyclotella cf. meneghiniana]
MGKFIDLSQLLLLVLLFVQTHHQSLASVQEANDSETASKQSQPSRSLDILEAEARTARELSYAAAALQKDLSTCQSRVQSIQKGFQNLYSTHLANVDGLRKCKEGMLGTQEMEELEAKLGKLDDKVDPELLVEAQQKEDDTKRKLRDEELASKHKELILSLEKQVRQLRLREKAWERTISELVARRDLLERREGAWERTIGELMGEVEVRAKRESWWKSMKAEMESRIGTLSRIGVLERFGPGPHYISIVVNLDDEQNPASDSSHREFIIELAPLDLMPHSIHLFLSQIAEGYWSRGTPAIVINPGHVLQACPHPCLESVSLGGKYPGDPYFEMKRAGIDSVSFQEYNPRYPHEKYTVGWAGRPHSGPEFYINLLNNTLDHGPVEQRKKELGDRYIDYVRETLGGEFDEKVLEPDPCFGKVVQGFDVVDKIAERITWSSLPSKEGERGGRLDDHLLVRPVEIVSVSILDSLGMKGGGDMSPQVGHTEL